MINLFVTGSNSNSGTSFITAGLAITMQSLGYQSAVYKPVDIGAKEKQGFVQSVDLAYVKNLDPYIKTAFSYSFKSLAAPVISAENENLVISKDVLKSDFDNLSKEADCVLLEGTQGVMTPLGVDFLEADLVSFFNTPLLLVVKPVYGAINQTLLSLEYLYKKGISVRGIIINNSLDETDKTELKNLPRLVEEYSNSKILGIIQDFSYMQKIDPNNLITNILNGIDIESVFDIEITKLKL
ncbi:MAG: dethiobiotin synthase [bacterium]|nr:dethiobiotin synthase [bacterium]